ncbi:MAG: fibronectin type III domain-containing protein, partial [Ignavibacteriaceae bacterium]|nr:fibronectin type III domain-containing protein [Ignavibacteriaceae bacterium]
LSTNNGTSWTAVNNGLTNSMVNTFVVNGTNLFAGTQGGGVYLSTNNGSSWTAVNNGLAGYALYIYALTVSGTNFFVATDGGGVYLSTNNGSSWTAVNGNTVQSLALYGTNLFAGADLWGVFLSTNNGTNWTSVNDGLTNSTVNAFVVNGNTLFAGALGIGVWRRPLSEMITLAPMLTTNKNTLSITTNTSDTLIIKNNGGGTLNWSLGNLPQWLGVYQSNGSLTSGQQVSVRLFALTYPSTNQNYSLNINSNGGNQSVSVNYNSAQSSNLVISNLTPQDQITLKPGQNTTYSIVVKDNTNNVVPNSIIKVNDEIAGNILSTQKTDNAGATTYQTAAIPSATPDGYIYTITFTATNPNSVNSDISTRKIKVSNPNEVVTLSNQILSYSALYGSTTLPVKQTINISSNNAASYQWQITNKPTWLNISSTQGSGDASIDFQPNTTNLSTQSSPYYQELTLTLTPGNITYKIKVTYNVLNSSATTQTIGKIVIKANEITSTGTNQYLATGNVNINNILWFTGSLNLNNDPVNPSISGNGEIYVNVNLTGTTKIITLYSGQFSVGLDPSGLLKNFTLSAVNEYFQLAGVDCILDDITFISDGVQIDGELQFSFFQTKLKVTTIQITTTSLPKIAGELSLQNVQLLSGLNLQKLNILFDQIRNSFAIDAYVTTPAFNVGCMLGVTNSKLDSLEFTVGGFDLGLTGLKLESVSGGVFNLQSQNIEFRIHCTIVPEAPLIDQIVQLKNLGLSYILPSHMTGSGDLTLFNKYQLSDAYIDFLYPQYLGFGGGFDVLSIFKGNAALKLNFAPIWTVEGSMIGSLQIPDGEGVPYDFLKSLPWPFAVEFPIQMGVSNNQFCNLRATGSYIYHVPFIGAKSISYYINFEPVLRFQLPEVKFDLFGGNLNKEIFADLAKIDKLKNRKNKFEGMGIKIGNGNNNKFSKNIDKIFNQSIPINQELSTLILRLTGTPLSQSKLITPDGVEISATDTISQNKYRIIYTTNDSLQKTFWIISRPKKGNWALDILDGTTPVLDIIGLQVSPIIKIQSPTTNSTDNKILLTSTDPGTSTSRIWLYYDIKNTGLTGCLIDSTLIPIDGSFYYSWNPSNNVLPGTYYIYAVLKDGDKVVSYDYSKGEVIIPGSIAAPQNVIASINNTIITIGWDSSSHSGLSEYLIKYWDKGSPSRVNYFSTRDTNTADVSDLPSGRTYIFGVAAVDTSGKQSDFSLSNEIIYKRSDINNPPIIQFSAYDSLQSTIWNNVSFNLNGYDADGDKLFFNPVNAPVDLKYDNFSGAVSWTPTPLDYGTKTLNVRLTDGKGGVDTIALNLSVQGVGRPDVKLNRTTYDSSQTVFITVSDNSENKSMLISEEVQTKLNIYSDTISVSYTNSKGELVTDFAYYPNSTKMNGSYTVTCKEIDANSGVFQGAFNSKITSIQQNNSKTIPTSYKLFQNYPNPFNGQTIIKYQLTDRGWMTLEVFDILGRKIRTLVNEFQLPGEFTLRWDGKNDNGKMLASGVYIYRMRIGTFVSSKKLMMLK